MTSFGLICEGATDQKVISNILDGFFGGAEVTVNKLLPYRDETDAHRVQSYSNWRMVIDFCDKEQLCSVLQYNDYLIIQIDTDVSDEPGFAVSKIGTDGVELQPETLYCEVKNKIINEIGQDFYNTIHDRLIFAISIHSLECWILPLYSDRYQSNTKSCLKHLNVELGRKDKPTISPSNKDPRVYDQLTRPYRKKRELDEKGVTNPSLKIFLEDLTSKSIQLKE